MAEAAGVDVVLDADEGAVADGDADAGREDVAESDSASFCDDEFDAKSACRDFSAAGRWVWRPANRERRYTVDAMSAVDDASSKSLGLSL